MLKINNAALAKALSRAEKIVESRNTIPILGMVKLVAENDRLAITTTNLDIEYRQTLECFADTPFSCCVDAKRLSQMANVANKDITMDLDGSILTVKSGRSKWSAPALPADDFPTMPVSDLSDPIAFDGAELSKIIDRTIWAADVNPTRHHLCGVFVNDGSFVATTGQILALIETDMEFNGPNVIAATPFLKSIQSFDGECELAWDDRKMQFSCGDVTITGKVIDGTFPDYRRVIPAPCEAWAVDSDELAGAVKRVRVASDAKERKLRIRKGDNALHVRIEGTAGFEAEEEIQADCSDGFEFGINADYLSQVLTALDADSVTVEQADQNAPIVFRPTSQKPGLSFTGIVMPMRI